MEMIGRKIRTKVVLKTASAEAPYSYKLTADQLQHYRENGFLIIRKLVDINVLNKCKEHFVRICEGLESPGNMTVVKERSLVGKSSNVEGYINKLQDIQFDDVFMTYSEHPVVLDVVTQLIGDDISVMNYTLINKPPGSSEHPPHQDLHYSPFRPADKLIGTWTAIDNATIENGCLWVVPGSHKDNVLHRHVKLPGALKLYHGIADESVARPHKRVPLEMSPGDTVLLNSLLIHGSGANNSKNYRKSLVAHYMNTHCESVDVRGTDQDIIREDMEGEARRRGLEGLSLQNYRKSLVAHYMDTQCESVDVRGTDQDIIREDMEAEAQRRGLEGLSLQEIWRLKGKELRRRSQL